MTANEPVVPSLRARLLLLLVISLLCLGGVEIALRLWAPREPNVRLQQFAEVVQRKHDVTFEKVFEWDSERFWKLVPNVVMPDDAWPLFGRISNGRGLREDHDVPFEKPAGETRILFVGDSWTFGYLVAHDETFPYLVEEELRRRLPDRGIECLNAGVPGYSLFQGWRFLETEGFDYDPDLVVVCFGWNAATPWDGLSDQEQLDEYRAGRPPAFLGWSRGCQILWQWKAKQAREVAPPDSEARDKPRIRPRLTPEEFGVYLEWIYQAARERGVALMVLVPATSVNLDGERMIRTLYQEKQFEFAGRFAEGAPDAPLLVDGIRILRSLKKQEPDVELFTDGVHTSAAANARLADRIASRIVAWLAAR